MLTSHPPRPEAILLNVPLYKCITFPCAGVGAAARRNAALLGLPRTTATINLPFGFGSTAFGPVERIAGAPAFGSGIGVGSFLPLGIPARVPVPISPPPARDDEISAEEHAEIDAERDRLAAVASRIESLGEYTSTIHPDRLMALAEQFIAGPVGPPPPPVSVLPVVQTHPVARGPFIPDPRAAPAIPARDAQSDLPDSSTGENAVANLNAIISTAASLTGLYGQVQAIRNPVGGLQPAMMAMPAVAAAGRALAPIAGRGVALLRGTGKIAAIAAATGLSMEAVDMILKAGSPRRRRRKMLTDGDFTAIAKMHALLGNSKAFSTWLAANGLGVR